MTIRRSAWLLVGALALLAVGWFVAAESGEPVGGLAKAAAVAAAETYVHSSAPLKEDSAVPGPYLFLGWQLTDARPFHRIVWRVTLQGVFDGHCMPTEANSCFPETIATVIVDYFTGSFVTVFYG